MGALRNRRFAKQQTATAISATSRSNVALLWPLLHCQLCNTQLYPPAMHPLNQLHKLCPTQNNISSRPHSLRTWLKHSHIDGSVHTIHCDIMMDCEMYFKFMILLLNLYKQYVLSNRYVHILSVPTVRCKPMVNLSMSRTSNMALLFQLW